MTNDLLIFDAVQVDAGARRAFVCLPLAAMNTKSPWPNKRLISSLVQCCLRTSPLSMCLNVLCDPSSTLSPRYS